MKINVLQFSQKYVDAAMYLHNFVR